MDIFKHVFSRMRKVHEDEPSSRGMFADPLHPSPQHHMFPAASTSNPKVATGTRTKLGECPYCFHIFAPSYVVLSGAKSRQRKIATREGVQNVTAGQDIVALLSVYVRCPR